MKRGLVFTLCALAAASLASSAMAQNVQLSLNLRYTDPADPSEGGKWFLVAKTDDPEGLAGISAYISNITAGAANSSYGNGTGAGSSSYTATTAAQLGAITNGGVPFFATISGAQNIVYGQDIAAGPVVADVGQGVGTPGNTPNDPLKNAAWNNAAIIATGTFSGAGGRPAFVTAGTNVTDANTLASTTPGVTPAQNANTTTTVRGDSLRSLGLNTPTNSGLLRGDTDRDFDVDADDLNNVLFSFNQTGKTWDQGDVTDGVGGHVEGTVDADDLNQVLFSFNQNSLTPPPAVASVPEPATLGLLVLAMGGVLAAGRRRS